MARVRCAAHWLKRALQLAKRGASETWGREGERQAEGDRDGFPNFPVIGVEQPVSRGPHDLVGGEAVDNTRENRSQRAGLRPRPRRSARREFRDPRPPESDSR